MKSTVRQLESGGEWLVLVAIVSADLSRFRNGKFAVVVSPLPVTISDFEGHFCRLKPLCLTYFGK